MSRGYGCLLRTGRTKSEVAREALRRQIAVARFRKLRTKTLPFARSTRTRYRRGCVPRPVVRVFPDTNVLVSAFASRGLCADLLDLVLPEARGRECTTASALRPAARRLLIISASDAERGLRSAKGPFAAPDSLEDRTFAKIADRPLVVIDQSHVFTRKLPSKRPGAPLTLLSLVADSLQDCSTFLRFRAQQRCVLRVVPGRFHSLCAELLDQIRRIEHSRDCAVELAHDFRRRPTRGTDSPYKGVIEVLDPASTMDGTSGNDGDLLVPVTVSALSPPLLK